MPTRRNTLRGRAGWSDDHLDQLCCGHDWHRDAWGRLSQLSDQDLLRAIEEMSQCWAECQDRIRERLPRYNRRECAWFAKYAADTWQLFIENHKARSYMEYQRANNGYRPYEEFEAQYAPPPKPE